MKRLLVHSLVFGPDGVSTAYLYNDIAAAFAAAGWQVTVVTTTPHFNPPQDEKEFLPSEGIKIIRVPMRRFSNFGVRALSFAWWHLASFFVILLGKRPDVILSPSPPPTVGLLNIWLGWLKGCKVVYNVQEIYPDILQKLHGLPLKVMKRMERRIYDGSDAVITIDQVFRDTIAPRFKDASKLHIIPNFVDTELYRPMGAPAPADKIQLLYAGNIGYAQDWDLLLDLAEKTAQLPVEYCVVGEGVRREHLAEGAAERHLDNIRLMPYQPREKMPELLAASDANFIFMLPSMDRQGFPSKVYTIMACARPLIVSSGEGTPIVNFLKGMDCGQLFCGENRAEAMAEYLSKLLEAGLDKARAELRKAGASGRKLIEEQYSREKVTSRYVELLESLLK